MTTSEQQRLDDLRDASVSFFRNKLTQLLSALGIAAAGSVRGVINVVVLLLLGCNLFLFLNIALGFYLGGLLGDSPAMGFLMLAGLYAVLIIVFLLVRGALFRAVNRAVARQVIRATDRVNHTLDLDPRLRIPLKYVPDYVATEPNPYEALVRRSAASSRQVSIATQEIGRGVAYIKGNYRNLAFGAVEDRMETSVPGYKFISPYIKRLREPERSTKQSPINPFGSGVLGGKGKGKLSSVKPYVQFALSVARPVLTSYLIGQGRGVLSRMLGMKPKRKRKRRWFGL